MGGQKYRSSTLILISLPAHTSLSHTSLSYSLSVGGAAPPLIFFSPLSKQASSQHALLLSPLSTASSSSLTSCMHTCMHTINSHLPLTSCTHACTLTHTSLTRLFTPCTHACTPQKPLTASSSSSPSSPLLHHTTEANRSCILHFFSSQATAFSFFHRKPAAASRRAACRREPTALLRPLTPAHADQACSAVLGHQGHRGTVLVDDLR